MTGQRGRVSGVIAATLTPMSADGAPDIALLAAHCRRLMSEGCSHIVLLGTTGEANSFGLRERREVLEGLIASGFTPAQLIVGTGCCAVADTVELSRHALSLGVVNLLVLPPFYYKKVSEAGIFEAYAKTIEGIADGRARIYCYQIPQMSGLELSVALVERLLKTYPETIVGLKDSSGAWENTQALCSALADRIDILVGTEVLLVRAMHAGAAGCVSATANVNAAAIAELFRHAASGAAPDGLETRVTALREAFERYPMIPALKAYLAERSSDDKWRNLRPPLVPLGQAETVALVDMVATLGAPALGKGGALPKK